MAEHKLTFFFPLIFKPVLSIRTMVAPALRHTGHASSTQTYPRNPLGKPHPSGVCADTRASWIVPVSLCHMLGLFPHLGQAAVAWCWTWTLRVTPVSDRFDGGAPATHISLPRLVSHHAVALFCSICWDIHSKWLLMDLSGAHRPNFHTSPLFLPLRLPQPSKHNFS